MTNQLSPLDKEVLAYFATYHYLTIKQLMLLMGVRKYNSVTERVANLIRNGYLIRIERGTRDLTTGKLKRLDAAYSYGKKGYAYAKRNDILLRAPRTAKEDYQLADSSLTHTLTATDILLSFRCMQHIDILYEQQDQELIGDPFVVDMHGQEKTFYADSTIIFSLRNRLFCCPIEVHNVGNVTRAELGEKVANYVALYDQKKYRHYFDIPEALFLVLFIAVQGEASARSIRTAIEQQLTLDKKEDRAPLFRVAPLVSSVYTLPLLPVWQRPYQPEPQALFRQ